MAKILLKCESAYIREQALKYDSSNPAEMPGFLLSNKSQMRMNLI